MGSEGRPPDDDSTRTSSARPSGAQRIGSFRVVRKLGEGGMGIVYEAEQERPHRAVALKVIRGGEFLDTTRVKLFQREAQTLARLKHPSIAAIYEMGRTDDGQHFFAMELVRGETLGDWVKHAGHGSSRSDHGSSAAADPRVRLGLFHKICEAVAYAHQRGVIHRDLKPANILVLNEPSSSTSASTLGVPDIKILDFGLARITDTDVAVSTVVSELGTIRGTLPYMSPEQVRGNPDEIDLRADVYSLGVILYELLTDRLPYDVTRAQLPEAMRVICEEPPRPPTRTSPGAKRIDRDITTIAFKALEKEPARRYQSVVALAEDVQRYLSDQPILARPPSAAYQFRKLVARHKLGFSFLALLFLLLAAFGATMTVQARRIARERDRATAEKERANREAETSKQVSDFLVSMFHLVDPGEARGNSITVREVLDRGAQQIERELEGQPAIEVRLMGAMGRVYHGLGLYSRGETLLRQALKIDEQELGQESLETAELLDAFIPLLQEEGRPDEAVQAARRAVAIKERLLPPGDVSLARSLYREGSALVLSATPRDRLDAAALLEQARRIFEAKLGPDAIEVGWCWNDLGVSSGQAGDYVAARGFLRRALEVKERALPPDHPDLARGLNYLGYALLRLQAYDEARPLLERALAIEAKAYGEEHPEFGNTLQSLGELWWRAGEPAKALPYLQRAVNIRENQLGPDSVNLVADYMALGATLRDLRRYREAEPYLRKALSLAEAGPGVTPVAVPEAAFEYAKLLSATGREGEARLLERRVTSLP